MDRPGPVIQDRPHPGGAAPRPALSGRVLDAARRPVAGAVVMFSGSSPEHHDIGQRTGAEGRFFYPALRPGRYTLFARDEAGRAGGAEVEVGREGGAEVEIVLSEETP